MKTLEMLNMAEKDRKTYRAKYEGGELRYNKKDGMYYRWNTGVLRLETIFKGIRGWETDFIESEYKPLIVEFW